VDDRNSILIHYFFSELERAYERTLSVQAVIMGWPVLALYFEACWFGELSQQPIRPHSAHLRRCSHHPPVAKQSTQPVPVGFAVGLMPSLKLHGLSCLISTQTDYCSIYVLHF
jgi:hypothetical protein